MRKWTVDDAKARFGEMLDTCLSEGSQMVFRDGEEAAVLVPQEEWRRVRDAVRPSLKALLLSDQARSGLMLLSRGLARRHDVQL